MTRVYITIDTEYSSSIATRKRSKGRQENFDRCIMCETPEGPVGIGYQLDMFDQHSLKAVFFVDPMPALLWGVEAISDVVGPIIERGHDVQLHLHTEWLALAGTANPLGDRTGQNIKDFTFDEQCELIDLARSTLMAAGAPAPIAFRAGNYGANDDTLRALAELGFQYDTSHCPGIADSHCDISLGPDDRLPLRHLGVTEVPIGCIESFGGGLRHGQITALSRREILAAIRYTRKHKLRHFTLVSHSFELMSRKRRLPNHVVRRRFELLCADIAAMKGVRTATYAEDPPRLELMDEPPPILPHNILLTAERLAEQVIGNALYGA